VCKTHGKQSLALDGVEWYFRNLPRALPAVIYGYAFWTKPHYPEKQHPETQQLPFCDISVINPNYLSPVQQRKQ